MLGSKAVSLRQIFLLIIILVSMLATFPEKSLSNVGTTALLGLSGICFVAVMGYIGFRKSIPRFYLSPILWALGFLVINLIGVFNKSDSRFFIVVYQFVFLFCFFIICASIEWQESSQKFFSRAVLLFVMFNAILFLREGMPRNFSGIFSNSNTFGTFLFYGSFFVLLAFQNKRGRLTKIIPLLAILILIYFSSTRAVYLSIIAVLGTYILWHKITSSKKIFSSYFTIVSALVVSFIYVYPRLINWSGFYSINNFVREYTGKNVYSGRQMMWLDISNLIDKKPLLGYGAGTVPRDFFNIELSSHNLYIQIMLQVGILGTIVFFLLLRSIWKLTWYGKDDKRVRIAASFMIGILIEQSFEVSLTQNAMSVAILQWFIFAIAIGLSHRKLVESIQSSEIS